MDPATLSEAGAAEVALTVKAVAHALEQHGTPNGYQRVYSEMYRRYRISTPRARYKEVLAWLAGGPASWAKNKEIADGSDD